MEHCTCGVDVEPSDLQRTTTVRARTTHRCCECGDTIAKGGTYEVIDALNDGSWSRYKTCELCVRIRTDLCPRYYYYAGLRELIMECLGFDYVTGELARWARDDEE